MIYFIPALHYIKMHLFLLILTIIIFFLQLLSKIKHTVTAVRPFHDDH